MLADYQVPRFRAFPLLRNPHLNTAALLLPRRRGLLRGGEARELPVGQETSLRVILHRQPDPEASWLVLVHGLTGSADSTYMVGTAKKALRAGIQVARVNMRGCGGTEHLAPTLYHAGLSEDVRAVVDFLIGEDGAGRIVLCGFSMGGNQVLKLAGEYGDAPPSQVAGLVAVSAAVDVRACAEAIDTLPALRLYRNRFLRDLKDTIALREKEFPGRFDLGSMSGIETLRQLDEAYTAPSWGFRDADDYYRSASALDVIEDIALPSLVLVSRDDPLVPITSLAPLHRIDRDSFRLHVTEGGGHVAFVAARGRGGDPDRRWAENRVVEFVRHLEPRHGWVG